jgi:4-hydroxybenzoate polyprenyltransferase
MIRRLTTYASLVRFSHSVFALPFALSGAILAAEDREVGWARIGWIVVAMVAARTAAMGFNRLVDADHDALNPRTAGRELPRGLTTRREVAWLVALSSVVFGVAAFALGPLCFALSPLALAIVFWYSLAKRYTPLTQLFLGIAMAVAPVGGWLAAGGRDGWEPVLLGLAIGTWVAGFDILYACQDVAFDRAHGLRSIPVRYGVPTSLRISRGCHLIAVLCLASLALVRPMGALYLLGVTGVGLLLVYEQSLVRADDLTRVKLAFDLNGYVGIYYFVMTAASLYTRHGAG